MKDTFLVIGAVVATFLVVTVPLLFLAMRRARASRGPDFDGWRAVAAQRGLRQRGVRLEGRIGERTVSVVLGRDGGKQSTTIVLTARPGFGATSKSDPGHLLPPGRKMRSEDHAFDELVEVFTQDDAALAAMLDAPTRERVRQVCETPGTIRPTDLRLRLPGFCRDAEVLLRSLDDLLALADELERRAARSVPERLAEIASKDPAPGIRRRCLGLLTERFANTAFAAEAARRAIGDSDSGVRAQAAPIEALSKGAGAELMAIVGNEALPENERRDALSRASAVLDRDEILGLYDFALGAGTPAMQRDAIGGFARLKARDGISRMAEVATSGAEDETLVALAEALAKIGGDEAQPVLVSLLAIESPDVRAAAAKALGRIGSPAAIEALRPLSLEPLGHPDAKAAASDAIAAIRTRHPGAVETAGGGGPPAGPFAAEKSKERV